jgi:uracil-DNA glycosylase family 4
MKAKGFFKTDNLSKIRIEGSSCHECKLYKEVCSPKMEPTGEGLKETLIIGEAPGENEDIQGVQLIGEAGNFLREKLKKLGLNLDRDFWKDNAVRCRPTNKEGKNRPPTKYEISLCKENIEETIKKLKPKFIWLLGSSAVESYFLNRFSNTKISLWRGLCIPDYKWGAWVIPMLHPSFAKRKETDELTQTIYNKDLDFAVSCWEKEALPEMWNVFNCVHKLKQFDEVCNLLDNIRQFIKSDILVFDYETTGLKPYREGHKIASISLCTEEFSAYSFPYQYRNHFSEQQLRVIKRKWKSILKDGEIGKVAQNFKYEDVWSKQMFGVEDINWVSCTMNTSHLLDNRKSFSGLKFQTFIRYGVEGYDKTVEPLLKSQKGPYNRVMDIDLDELLLYNGLDSLFTYWLYLDQQEEISHDKGTQKAHDFIMQGLKTFADIQHNGIQLDRKYYEEQSKSISKELVSIENTLKNYPEIKDFNRRNGKVMNFQSDADVRELFFNQLKFKPSKKTGTDLDSVDHSVLSSINHPIAEELIRHGKLSKTKSTYVDQFLRECEDNAMLHPFFDLHTTRTFRSSSSGPNFQNIPVRDDEAKKASRLGIIPSKGNLFIDPDYGSQEVRIAACYTKDPVLIDYINDETTDMHRDTANDIFCLEKAPDTYWKNSKTGKKVRFFAKNGFVFPEFYGSYWKSCAVNLWTECKDLLNHEGVPLWEHLINQKIIKSKNLVFSNAYKDKPNAFENHIKNVEEKFWKRFVKFKEWQLDVLKEFKKYGYIRLFHGMKYGGGIASPNELINAPIQGTAFHCLLWSVIQINKRIKEEKLKSKLIGQIHDSMLYDTAPEERDYLKCIIKDVAEVKIREVHPWIIVPLVVEFEETEIDQPWYYKKEIK